MNHVTRPEPERAEAPRPETPAEALALQREAMRQVLDSQRETLAELARR